MVAAAVLLPATSPATSTLLPELEKLAHEARCGLRAGSDAAQIRIPVLTRRLQFRVFTFWIVHGALYLHLVCFCNEVGYIV